MNYLIYSSSREPNCNEEEISEIIDACLQNNPIKDVTGILIYSTHFFIQYIEGELEEITNLYLKIKKDQRHSDILFLGTGDIEKRNFPNWHMVAKKFNVKTLQFETEIENEERKIFNSILKGTNLECVKGLAVINKLLNYI